MQSLENYKIVHRIRHTDRGSEIVRTTEMSEITEKVEHVVGAIAYHLFSPQNPLNIVFP